MENHIISVKKKNDEFPHIGQFGLNLFSNQISTFLHQPSPTSQYLFLNATEVLHWSAWAMADKQLSSHQFSNYRRNWGFGYLQAVSIFHVFHIPFYVWHLKYTRERFKHQWLDEAEVLCYIVLKQYSRVYILI